MTALLDVQTLSRSFGGLHVTRDVSFSLAQGDRVALIGPNGAGKTTLINLITGGILPSDGRINLGGVDVSRMSIPRRVHRGLVRTFQITRLFKTLSVADNVALTIMQRRGLTRRILSSATENADVKSEWSEILEMLGLQQFAYSNVGQLAYGQQRLIELAISLALKPKVLLLDEPAAGVPHDEAHRIFDALACLPDNIAVLMIEHDMDLVFKFARRVLVLAAGQLIFEGTPAQVFAHDEVRRAYLGNYADACVLS